jgi:GntR family transcriptional regulator
MFLHIQPGDNLAIYDQVVRQIKFAVASGALAPGDFVLSVRELARELAINPNTVARAYRQLQDEGVLESVRGTGLAVARGAAQKCRKQRLDLVGRRIREALQEARQSQLQDEELRDLVQQELDDVLKSFPPTQVPPCEE